jgi:hypothetical protein
MRIMGFLKADAQSEAGAPPSPEVMEKMGSFVQEVMAAGVVESTDGLTPSSSGKRVVGSTGSYTVTDGPFPLDQVNAAYCIFNVPTFEDAVHWAQRFLDVLGGGECELRPFVEFGG